MNKSMLLVEDNSDEVELTLMALKQSGISRNIVVARDGVEALDYLFAQEINTGRSCDESPAFVLLDLNLPRLNGIEVLNRIRNDDRTKLIPVIILTSSNDSEDRITALSAGANSYLRKPLGYPEFVLMMKRLGDYWFLVNANKISK